MSAGRNRRGIDGAGVDPEALPVVDPVQSFGYLVVVSNDGIVAHVSENCGALFGLEAQAMIGLPADRFLGEDALKLVRSSIRITGAPGRAERIFDIDLKGDGRRFDLAAHHAGGLFVIEAEPAPSVRHGEPAGLARKMIERARGTDSIGSLCETAARELRALTGYDRVTVCRFGPDGGGDVMAECPGEAGVFRQPYFLASGNPVRQPARQRGARGAVRVIADIDDPGVPVIPAHRPDGEPPDLSMSELRAVSPARIECLRAMGVRASMVVPVLRRGELWGLLACHHRAPLIPDPAVRAAAELFGEVFPLLLDQAEIGAADGERETGGRGRDVLIAELNHRVRNILNLTRSVVTQSRDSADTIDRFTQIVGERIHALARAHDQATRSNRAPASLRDLIETEGGAYHPGGGEARLAIRGVDALVTPAAFSSLALVFHELMTNSCKYGALSVAAGSVAVSAARMDGGALAIEWRELNGPAVVPPERRGFGSSIIERIVPHELGGEAKVEFHPAGLIARFVVPAVHIAAFRAMADVESAFPHPAVPHSTVEAAGGRAPVISGEALVVEDNMLIAMEAEDILTDLGAARCHVAGSVRTALALADAHAIGFALLDVNLGQETVEPVARVLRQRGVPFVFASGYGDRTGLPEEFAGVSVVTKPYSLHAVRAAIRKHGASR